MLAQTGQTPIPFARAVCRGLGCGLLKGWALWVWFKGISSPLFRLFNDVSQFGDDHCLCMLGRLFGSSTNKNFANDSGF